MPSLRLAALLFVAGLLAIPVAQAADAEGTFRVAGPLALPQGGSVSSTAADLLWNGDGLPTMAMSFDGLVVERWGTSHTVQPNPLGGAPIRLGEEGIDERRTFGAGSLALSVGDGAQLVALNAAGAFVGELADATLLPVGYALLAAPGDGAFDREFGGCADAQNCIGTASRYETTSQDVEGSFTGAVKMLVRGPTVTVSTSGEDASFSSGHTVSQVGTATTTDDAWVLVRATGATITFAGGSPATLYLDAPVVTTTQAEMDGATGALDIGLRSYRAVGDTVAAAGDLRLRLAPVPPSLPSDTSNTAYAAAFTADVAGDVQSINLRAVPLYEDKPTETAGAAMLLATLLGAAWYFGPALKFHGMSALLPMYTRLSKPDILDNEVRNGIYDIIRQNPGISARAVHRMSDQSWGTVVYHLRQLERHNLVVSRTLGRTRNYYENHGKYRGMETQLACLQSDRARALARVVVRAPGITQELLAEQSGFPQPTTSYYVRKLKRAGLVEEHRDGRYAKYTPHVDLERFLEMAESSEPVPPPAPASSQAQA